MTKKEFIERYAELMNVKKVEAKEKIEETEEVIEKLLLEGESVPLNKIGIFSLIAKGKRVGRNPKTGEEVQISERVVPKFKFSSVLKNKIKEGVNKNDIK